MLRTSWQESPKYTERSNTRILASANRPGPQPAENKGEVLRFPVRACDPEAPGPGGPREATGCILHCQVWRRGKTTCKRKYQVTRPWDATRDHYLLQIYQRLTPSHKNDTEPGNIIHSLSKYLLIDHHGLGRFARCWGNNGEQNRCSLCIHGSLWREDHN